MPRPLCDQEILDFIMAAPRTGHLATVRPDGRPHVATLWLAVDAGDIVFVTSSTTVKARNFRHRPLAAVAVDDPNPPFSHVMLEGPVTIVDDIAEVRRWVRRIAARYIGDDAARAFSEMEDMPDDLFCRLSPTHMTGLADMAS